MKKNSYGSFAAAAAVIGIVSLTAMLIHRRKKG